MAIHICHISQCAGGVETYVLNLLRHCDRKTFRHTVICYDDGTLAEKAKDAEADVILVPMVRSISPLKDLVSLIQVLSVIRKIKPDIIHAHSGKGGIFGRLCGTFLRIPIGLTPNAFSYLGQTGTRRSIIMAIEKLLSYTPTILIASSPSEARRAIEEVGWKPRKVTARFSNSIDIREEKVRHSAKKEIKVLMIGRLCYQKNPEMLLRVARAVNTRCSFVKFTILGAGYSFADPKSETAQRVAQMMQELDLEEVVTLKPWAGPEVVEQVLLNSDIYVSTSRYESFGYTTAEAMEKALPVVATSIDGSIDLIEHGKNGYLVDIDDDNAMVAYICDLAADSLLRERLGESGREKVNKSFNIRNNIAVIESIYRTLYEGLDRNAKPEAHCLEDY